MRAEDGVDPGEKASSTCALAHWEGAAAVFPRGPAMYRISDAKV